MNHKRSGLRTAGGLMALATLLPAGAWAAPSQPAREPSVAESAPSLAVVVGTNRGGPGQSDLRFAEDDARAVAGLLTSLGRYRAGDVDLLLRPSLHDVERALDLMAARAQAARRQGGEVQALFYYSGHARANALNLASDELPLADLRTRLVAMPATITIVVLDACQSGAISQVKGAEPTADFSYNSVNRLNNTGIAVMASSSGTELSQESESFGASYFTHNLLTGLRGAGDADRDGRVTLVEAYRYAYNQTLAATAATAVGSQHATLETGLRGKGEVVLSYPAAASAQLELPAALDGEILLRLESAGAVLVELHKAEGRALRLALSPGRYVVVHRRGPRVRRCTLALGDHHTAVLDAGACADVEQVAVAAKGPAAPPRARWIFQGALGGIAARNDRYVGRLEDFGFQDSIYFGMPRFSVQAARALTRHLAVGLEIASLDERVFRRHSSATLSGQDERFWWATYALGAFVLSEHPLWRDHLIPYVRAGAALTYGRTSYQEIDSTTGAVNSDSATSDVGYALRAAAGLAMMPWRHVGFFGELNATYAPTVKDLLRDVHDSGGFGVLLGLRGEL
jgi:Caspase domain